jgi:dihydroorotase
MRIIPRRQFIGEMGAAVVAARILPALQTPSYDLLISGGRLIDASQQISDVRDVAISNGKVARIGVGIPAGQARQVIVAAGKLVTPGLIDVHGHVYDGIQLGVAPDIVGIPNGVTTIVDAGTTGSFTWPGFRKYVIEKSQTRVYAMLNIATIGLIGNELYLDASLVDPRAAIRTIEANRDRIVGIKVRINGKHEELAHDVEVFKKAREASDATSVPIMMHWSHEPDLLNLMKAGDILVHPFNPQPGPGGMLDDNGKILPQILALRDRGIKTDFGHGTHFSWEIAEKAAAQGWLPDTISTDMTSTHVRPTDPVVSILNVMSKFLLLGLNVDQVIEKVTLTSSQMFKYPERIGALKEGDTADVAILEVESGEFEFLDSRRVKRSGRQRFVHSATVRAGKLMS